MRLRGIYFTLFVFFALDGCFKPPTAEKLDNRKSPTETSSGSTKKHASTSNDSATPTPTPSPTDDGTTSSDSSTAPVTTLTPLSADADSSLTYYNFAKAVLDASCANCHGVPATNNAPSDFRLDTYADTGGLPGVFSKVGRIKLRTEYSTMPPVSSNNLSDADRLKLLAWIAAGAPMGTYNAPITVTSPSSSSESPTNSSYTINLSFYNIPNGSTYKVYYTTVSGATTGGTQIGSDGTVSATTASVVFDTHALANAVYYIYATVTSGSTTYKASAAGSVLVHDVTSPTVSLTWPPSPVVTNTIVASSWIAAESVVTMPASITFTGSDSDGDTLTYKIEYSGDNGASWTTLTTTQTASPYTWDTVTHMPAEGAGINFLIKVTATDNRGNSGVATTSKFAVAPTAYTYATDIDPILNNPHNYCSGCHATGQGNASNFTSDNYALATIGVKAKAESIAYRTNYDPGNPMPQSGGPLSASQLLTLLLWYWQGGN